MTAPSMIMLHIGRKADPQPLCLPAGSFAFTQAESGWVAGGYHAAVWHPGGSDRPWYVRETPEEIGRLLARAGVGCVAVPQDVEEARPAPEPDTTIRITREAADDIDKLMAAASQACEEVVMLDLDDNSIAALTALCRALLPFTKPLWETTAQLRARLGEGS